MRRNRALRRNYFRFNHLRAVDAAETASGSWKGVLPFTCLPGVGPGLYLPPMIARRQLIFGSALAGSARGRPCRRCRALQGDRLRWLPDHRSAGPLPFCAEALFPGRGGPLMEAWRTRQFEYTWLRTLSGRYADFWQVTQEALAVAAAASGLDLTPDRSDRLMQTFLELKVWPDVAPALAQLKARGRPHGVPGQSHGRDARGADAQRRARGIAGGAAQHRSGAGLQTGPARLSDGARRLRPEARRDPVRRLRVMGRRRRQGVRLSAPSGSTARTCRSRRWARRPMRSVRAWPIW